MLWGGEDLAADIGASANRADGRYTPPFDFARTLCLFGATAARVTAIDAVYTDFRDSTDCGPRRARRVRGGFAAKAAIHPGQVQAINEVFTPSDDALRDASASSRRSRSSRAPARSTSTGGCSIGRT